MNKEEFEGKWHQFKGKIQEKWSKFTHDDIAHINGKYDIFVGKLQKKYSFTKEQAEKELNSWQECCQKHGHPSKHHEISKGSCSEKQAPCKSHDKNNHKKNDHHQGHKEKDRKAS